MPLVVVIGRGHSGTRAISKTLCESGFFMGAELNESYDLVPADEMYEASRVAGGYVRHLEGTRWDFSRLLASAPPTEYREHLRAYLDSVLQSREANRGWKLPETVLSLPWIVRIFPEAYYIYWVRDPRDSILGRHLTDDLADFAVPYSKPDDLREMRAISWKYQRAIVAATPRPHRWLQLRFEDFVTRQEATLATLERFLGVPLAKIEVRADSVGRWRSDEGEHNFELFHEDLIELGYEEG